MESLVTAASCPSTPGVYLGTEHPVHPGPLVTAFATVVGSSWGIWGVCNYVSDRNSRFGGTVVIGCSSAEFVMLGRRRGFGPWVRVVLVL